MAADTTSTAIPGQARSPQINQWLASRSHALLIGNSGCPPGPGRTFETVNPAPGRGPGGRRQGRRQADVDEAVRAGGRV